MTKLNVWKMACIVFLFVFCAGAVIASTAQTFTSLISFDGTDGAQPYLREVLAQGINGNFYGTTQIGGNLGCGTGVGCGTVFEITPTGKLTTLYTFCSQPDCTDGSQPEAGLALGTSGNFYGTTASGGTGANCYYAHDCGTVFEITPAGKLTTIYSFCSQSGCPDGAGPSSTLVRATDGNFYGTTSYGGSSACTFFLQGCGTVFKIATDGKLTTLHTFCTEGYPECSDGLQPLAGLIQGTDGNLYGTTSGGGINRGGTVFEITTDGTLSTLYSFCSQPGCSDGDTPSSTLVRTAAGALFGTTLNGGAYLGGTIFEISDGALTTLYDFCPQLQSGCPDGDNSSGPSSLVLGTDGNLYGTTDEGGGSSDCTYGCGIIFDLAQLAGVWNLTTLHVFDSSDGYYPNELLQSTNGTFYGTTYYGGAMSDGTVFSLSNSLGPFVETLPGAGKVGAEVGILGNNLRGATSVTFDGTPATFTVKLPTLILTHVPTGATTGAVQVTLPSETLSSNVPFYVEK